MAEVTLFSPRKITPQNKRHLPESHDPNKRITYVQITLEENEIAEAIRNYIRAQVPVRDGEELPVVLTAGRGENGHSATVTMSVEPVIVPTVSRPIQALATFNETAAAAARRNSEDEALDNEEAETVEIELPVALANIGSSTSDHIPEITTSVIETEIQDNEQEVTKIEVEETIKVTSVSVKKSNLFGTPTQNLTPSPEVLIAAPSAPAEPEPTKKKSIFDSLK